MECVTLGHGLEEEVVKHEYYGTSAVIDDLKRMGGWEEGLVVLSCENVERDGESGMVVGLKKKSQISESVGLVV